MTADATHRHQVESLDTTPGDTQPAEHLPPAFGLNAVMLDRGLQKPVPGLVAGYVGIALPEGWLWCDGADGTPDLRDRYILLDGAAGASGKAEHSHQASHVHHWATAANADHPGYFGDIATPVDPVLHAASRVHRHSAGAETVSEGITTAAANAPPAVGMRFVMATAAARKLPDGIVIAYTGNRVPAGWRTLGGDASSELLGRLWKGEATGESYRLSGSAAHDHVLHSGHVFDLLAAEGEAGRDRIGQGPDVPIAGHRHRVEIDEQTPVAASAAMPRHVDLLLIVKH
ncbi:hypothetical protein ACFB49_34030 [Sphingomonas sp. DBB INV C78]